MPASCRENGFGLDLDSPSRIGEVLDADPGRRRANVAENLAVRARDLVKRVFADRVHPRSNDVLGARAGPGEGSDDDLQTKARLLVRVLRRRRAVRWDRRGPGDVDVTACDDGA